MGYDNILKYYYYYSLSYEMKYDNNKYKVSVKIALKSYISNINGG